MWRMTIIPMNIEPSAKTGRPVRRRRAAAAVALGLLLSGCGSSSSQSSEQDCALRVTAAIYPLAYVAEQIGGPDVCVDTLTSPGVEPHDLELTAKQVADLGKANVVLYIPHLQPAVDEAIKQSASTSALDATKGINLLGSEPHAHEDENQGGAAGADDHAGETTATDPHIWLDPSNMAVIGQSLADQLKAADPGKASKFDANSTRFGAAMKTLTAEYSKGVATCSNKMLVVTHEAFGYLARAFGFEQFGLSGLSPEAEPSPARLKSASDLIRAKGITTIYFEALVSPKVALTVASETGAKSAVLDPIEGATDGHDYTTIMKKNLDTLIAGQGCS